MKRIIFPLGALFLASGINAQDTYINERLTNNSNDVIGTARYVGMGGAMGALGADISVISQNPAGIGLYRKNDIALTFGGLWNNSRIEEESRGKGTFDQMGFVYCMKTGSEDCPFFNFAFNYQKKANYNYNFYADNPTLNGLSQMDVLAELASDGFDTDYNLAGLAVDYGYLTPLDADGNAIPEGDKTTPIARYINPYGSNRSEYTHHSQGSLQGYDINFSANIKERTFLGLTIGCDNVNYRAWTDYYEEGQDPNGTYDIYNDYKISGYGINVKLGTIIRPIEESSFRIGATVETPTWYRMKSSVLYMLTDCDYNKTPMPESYLEYTVRTPWKLRASIGSTIGRSFAWDVDYEWANYSAMHMGYPQFDDYYESVNSFSNRSDKAMNKLTKTTLKGVHTVRAGVEYRPVSSLALRLGYNYSSPTYENAVGFDQYSLNSSAMDYITSTNYMRSGATNIMTVGIGYHYKKFYVDLAYKVRNQSADFYAFDTSFTQPDSQFSQDNPTLANKTISPVGVNLTRQTVTCTLGFKF